MYEAVKYALIITAIAGALHLVIMVVIPGLIAAGVEIALGLVKGASVTSREVVLIPALATGVYYTILPFIAFRVLKPTERK